jgi:hypothetical protein
VYRNDTAGYFDVRISEKIQVVKTIRLLIFEISKLLHKVVHSFEHCQRKGSRAVGLVEEKLFISGVSVETSRVDCLKIEARHGSVRTRNNKKVIGVISSNPVKGYTERG